VSLAAPKRQGWVSGVSESVETWRGWVYPRGRVGMIAACSGTLMAGVASCAACALFNITVDSRLCLPVGKSALDPTPVAHWIA